MTSGTPAQMERLPSLTAVRYFSVAARVENFTLAARELCVTQGAVSRMIQALEADLGVELFERHGRRIRLTAEGRAYDEAVGRGLRLIADASAELRRAVADRPLTLMVNTGFASLWLVPRLGDFRQRHPEIEVHLIDGMAVDAEKARDLPLAIRFGLPPWPGFVHARLPLVTRLGVVCAPGLLAHCPVGTPQDLPGRPLLTFTADRRDPWQDYFGHFGMAVPDLGQSPRFFQLLMLREAAISGLGFALVPLFLFEADLQAGRLVQALEHTVEVPQGYYLTHLEGADKNAKVRQFLQWLTRQAEAVARRWAQGGA